MDMGYWYYTLSAIPQTLAAVIALSATFVVFKMKDVQLAVNATGATIKSFLMVAHPEKTYREIVSLRPKAMADEFSVLIHELRGMPSEGTDPLIERMMERTKTVAGSQGYFMPNKENMLEFLETSNSLFRDDESRLDTIKDLLKLSIICTVAPLIGSLLVLPHDASFHAAAAIPVAFTLLSGVSIIYAAWSVWRIATI
jgi:hypothetical protein